MRNDTNCNQCTETGALKFLCTCFGALNELGLKKKLRFFCMCEHVLLFYYRSQYVSTILEKRTILCLHAFVNRLLLWCTKGKSKLTGLNSTQRTQFLEEIVVASTSYFRNVQSFEYRLEYVRETEQFQNKQLQYVQYIGRHPRRHTYNPENFLKFDVVLVSVEAIGISIREAFFLTKSYNRHST